MHKITLLFGSNLGNSKKYIQDAIAELALHTGPNIFTSGMYASEPWGFESKNSFVNQAAIIDTDLNPVEILRIIQKIEAKLGRVRRYRSYTDRTIDIDILFYDNNIIETEELIIPHPRLTERKFVLTPLAELMPDFQHPVYLKTIRQLLLECTDVSEIKRIE